MIHRESIYYIKTEVQLDNLKTEVFNLALDGHRLRLRTAGRSDADYQAAQQQADCCFELEATLINNTTQKNEREISALNNGSRSPFRF